MADAEYSRLGCIECAKPLTWGQKHCSIACVGLSQRNREHAFTCENCGTQTHRRLGGSGSPKNRWCSMKCRVEQAARERVARVEAAKEAQMQARVHRNLIRELKLLVKAATPKPKAPSRKYLLPIDPTGLCKDCGIAYSRARGEAKTRCQACKKLRHATYLARYKQSDSGRAKKSAEKARRRARHNVRTDRINPFKVFDRDGWVCQMCGVPTPKSLRGSYEPNAPELDHVVSLANGGHHTWDNVQCACRSCNGSKGPKNSDEFVRGRRARTRAGRVAILK